MKLIIHAFWRRKYVKHKTVSNKNNCLDLLGKILEYFYDGYHVTNKAFSIKIGKTIILIKTNLKVLLLMVKKHRDLLLTPGSNIDP